jgi:arabinan endo-1,5-alpha-L-arabinosidase
VELNQIQIRDPFVVTVPEERAYYLFGSTDPDIWSGPGIGFDCYRSLDLTEWEGPVAAFRPPPGFWSPGCYWAPEVHRFGDGWFMFATFAGADGHRGTQVLRAARPGGPYEPWSDGAVTPDEWQCLDGTPHLDETGPWLVFCHEWVQCDDGEIRAVRLADDLRSTLGEVALLFRASEAEWASDMHVTDGPFLHRTAGGALLMLWSSMGARGYAIGLARSATGSVLGPWRQDDAPIWSEDGGHGMVFRAFDGQLYLTLHTPNESPRERAVFAPLVETDDDLRLAPRRDAHGG